MTGDTSLARLGTIAVLVVAFIAAVISYLHIENLAVTHAQPLAAAALLPLSIDGTVVASSMVMLRAARAGHHVPGFARFMLVLAVGATLAANVAYGIPHGWMAALISGWPAVAFIGCAEMAIGMARRMATPAAADARRAAVPADAQDAALAALRATTAAGNALSQRQLETRFGLSRSEATRVRQLVLAESNGHTPQEETS